MNRESEFLKKIYKKLTQENIDDEIFSLVASVSQIIKNEEKSKVKDVMAAIKKLIISQLEAKNKFFGLLVLNEIMKSGRDFVADYFEKKMSRRLVIITKHRAKERGKKPIEEIGSTCLKE